MIWKDIRYDIIHMIIISKCSSKNARVALEWPLSHFDWVPRWECHTPTFIWPEHVVHVFVKRNSVQSNVTQCIAKARNTDHCNKIQSHPMTILKCEVFTSNPNALKQSYFSGMDVTCIIVQNIWWIFKSFINDSTPSFHHFGFACQCSNPANAVSGLDLILEINDSLTLKVENLKIS